MAGHVSGCWLYYAGAMLVLCWCYALTRLVLYLGLHTLATRLVKPHGVCLL